MLKNPVENNLILEKSQLTEQFFSGCKQDKKIGIEFEKIPVYEKNLNAVKYEDIVRLMLQYNNGSWSGIFDSKSLIGMSAQDRHITLEPGSQFELSLNPVEKITDLQKIIDKYNTDTANLGEKLGICWLGYGIQPLSTWKNINIIPKKRYALMSKYLPQVASKPLVMMRETAGIQVGMDYSDEPDAMRKFRLALKLSPVISAVFSNSPVRNGRLTKYKSYRALSWLSTDNSRCGLVSSKLFRKNSDFSFSEYASVLLDVPMIFIERPLESTGAIPVQNLTFRNYLKSGYLRFNATVEDWELHSSLYFPDVRLKSYLEIRNHDNQRKDMIYAIPAFWKGILYDTDAMNAVESLFENFTYSDFQYIRHKAPKYGLDFSVKSVKLSELAKEILNISYFSLNNQNDGEADFLQPAIELVNKGLTPADVIINKWQNEWKNKLTSLVLHTKLS